MTSRDFCYWLQGFFEISGGGGEMSQTQVGMVRRHLALVFKHEIDAPDPTGELQATHDGTEPEKPTRPTGSPSKHGVLYRC